MSLTGNWKKEINKAITPLTIIVQIFSYKNDFKLYINKNPAVLNIIESYFLHQTEVDIKAMGHACKTVIKTNIYFPPITALDCKNLLKNN